MSVKKIKAELNKYSDPRDAVFLQKFFKTGVGQYGQGDIFIGVRVPKLRLVCRQFKTIGLSDVQQLLDSDIHEHRLAGLIIMTIQYERGDPGKQEEIYNLYLSNMYRNRINNWDLVDASAPKIVGAYLQNKPRNILLKLATSENLWQRRIAIISTFAFINQGDPTTSLEVAEILLNDKEDLIHKASGWMLREVGKRCEESQLIAFLDKHSQIMPRTMLRYSIEHLPIDKKKYYMGQKALHEK